MSILSLILGIGSRLYRRREPSQPSNEVVEKFRDIRIPSYVNPFSIGMQIYENKFSRITDLPEKLDEVLDIIKDPSKMIGRQIAKIIGGFKVNVN